MYSSNFIFLILLSLEITLIFPDNGSVIVIRKEAKK